MKKFTANYAETNHNFVIQNLDGDRVKSPFVSSICIVKNILQRGKPTLMSEYLQSQFGAIHAEPEFRKKFALIDKAAPQWQHIIKGDAERNYFPARTFLDSIIPEYLPEYTFIQQLIIPEVSINLITQIENKKFIDQCVDFFLPQAQLVIEINGQQHKTDDSTRLNDSVRKQYLNSHSILVIEIDTYDLEQRNSEFHDRINEIRKRLLQYERIIKYYRASYEELSSGISDTLLRSKLIPTAIIRFQMLVLELLEQGRLQFEMPEWRINILSHEVRGVWAIAIQDLFYWFKNLSILLKQSITFPELIIKECQTYVEYDYSDGIINVDFSVLKRWTDEDTLNPDTIFVRSDYFDYLGGRWNNFRVSVSDPLRYEISPLENESEYLSLKFFLRNIFCFDEFRVGQVRIIVNVLALHDTVGLLPTGAGKSLCYQLAALLQPCVSFVVCPLKSLMYDQKYNLEKKLIDSTNLIASDQTATQKTKIVEAFGRGEYLWVWISPERFQTKNFRANLSSLNKNLTLSYAVIDEVHCLSEWGHDFRTSYLNLAKTINDFAPGVTYLGLTATASLNVLKDIQIEFSIAKEDVKVTDEFTRPELSFYVINDQAAKLKKMKELLKLLSKKDPEIFAIKGEKTQSMLIFTPHKTNEYGCYDLSLKISKSLSVDARWFAGELPSKNNVSVVPPAQFDVYKRKTQIDFQENRFPILVSTKAFGMGIDKPNIRYTVHFGIPGSVESFYQEAGRAGRDRNPAYCYLLFSPAEISEDILNKIFHLNTNLNDLRIIEKQVGKDAHDLSRMLFLWLKNQMEIEHEIQLVKLLITKVLRSNMSEQIISTGMIPPIRINDQLIPISEYALEKAIFRSSILGMVDNWTRDWRTKTFCVNTNKYSKTSIIQSLTNYIHKYDQEYDVGKELDRCPGEFIEKVLRVLLEWVYNNFAYNRRQSLKTIYQYCKDFKNSDDFKLKIENIFRITETTFTLDHIVESPRDYGKWFDLFYEIKEGYRHRFHDKQEVIRIQGTLIRYLESFRNNTGLNVISGLVRLLLDDYLDTDGRPRFELGLSQIAEYDLADRIKILNELLAFSGILRDMGKEYLGEALCNAFPGNEETIYRSLGDSTSANLIIGATTAKLSTIIKRYHGTV